MAAGLDARQEGDQSDDEVDFRNPEQRQTVFRIPLKPVDNPDEFKGNDLHQVLANEFAAKYLEKIGATPKKSTVALVKKHVPLTEGCIKTQLKKRGCIDDEVQVTAPSLKQDYTAPVVIDARDLLAIGIANEISEEDEKETQRQKEAPDSGKGLDTTVQNFESACSKYLYPFNLHPTLAKKRDPDFGLERDEGAVNDVHDLRGTLNGSRKWQSDCRGGLAHSSVHTSKKYADNDDLAGQVEVLLDDIKYELSQDFTISPELILHIQGDFESSIQQWKSQKSPTSFHDHLTDKNFKHAMDTLRSDEVIDLFANMAEYLHDEYIPNGHYHPTHSPRKQTVTLPMTSRMTPSPPPFLQRFRSPTRSTDSQTTRATPLEDEVLAQPFLHQTQNFGLRRGVSLAPTGLRQAQVKMQEDESTLLARNQQRRLFAIHHSFANLRSKFERKSTNMFFTLPLVILSLRVFAESLFVQFYPLWTRSREGVEALKNIDNAILALLDPHGYHRNILMLQSSPAAVRLSINYQRKAHPPGHQHFSDTSPLVRAALGGRPKSFQARKILGTGMGQEWKTELGTRQKMVLFQQAWDRFGTGKSSSLANGRRA